MKFQYQVTHIPGSDLKIADALFRAPLPEITQTDKQLQQEADARDEPILPAKFLEK